MMIVWVNCQRFIISPGALVSAKDTTGGKWTHQTKAGVPLL